MYGCQLLGRQHSMTGQSTTGCCVRDIARVYLQWHTNNDTRSHRKNVICLVNILHYETIRSLHSRSSKKCNLVWFSGNLVLFAQSFSIGGVLGLTLFFSLSWSCDQIKKMLTHFPAYIANRLLESLNWIVWWVGRDPLIEKCWFKVPNLTWIEVNVKLLRGLFVI